MLYCTEVLNNGAQQKNHCWRKVSKMSPKQKQRIIIALVGLAGFGAAIGLVLYALSQNINLFFTPTDIIEQKVSHDNVVRLGGMVVQDSIVRQRDLKITFRVTDFKNEVEVYYQGILPDLFREGQGVVALGVLGSNGQFLAKEVLAKHDENYMPPEVAQALEKNKARSG